MVVCQSLRSCAGRAACQFRRDYLLCAFWSAAAGRRFGTPSSYATGSFVPRYGMFVQHLLAPWHHLSDESGVQPPHSKAASPQETNVLPLRKLTCARAGGERTGGRGPLRTRWGCSRGGTRRRHGCVMHGFIGRQTARPEASPYQIPNETRLGRANPSSLCSPPRRTE